MTDQTTNQEQADAPEHPVDASAVKSRALSGVKALGALFPRDCGVFGTAADISGSEG